MANRSRRHFWATVLAVAVAVFAVLALHYAFQAPLLPESAIFALLIHLDVWLGLLTLLTAIPVLLLCRRFERTYHVVVREIMSKTLPSFSE